MKKSSSLKNKLNTIIIFVTFVSFLANLIAVYYTWQNLRDIRSQNVKTVSYQLGNYLLGENERLGRIQQKIKGQVLAEDFFSLNELKKVEESRKRISEYVYNIQDVNNNPVYAVVVDNEGNEKIITETLISEEYDELKKIIGLYENKKIENGNVEYEYFKIDKPNYMKMLYLCCYTPVYDYDFKIGEIQHLGNMIVCTKINLDKLLNEYEDWSNLNLTLKKDDINLEVLNVRDKRIKEHEGITLNTIYVKNTDWKINGVIFGSELERRLESLIYLMIGAVVSVIVFMIIFHRAINETINKPVSAITGFLKRRANGDAREQLEMNASVEFCEIATGINEMLEADHEKGKRIMEQQSRLYEYEIRAKEAKISSLMGQINPHFLYNTLECMRTLALVNGADDVADIAVDIAEIMRYSLHKKDEATIQEEICMVEHYLSIMNARYPERFAYNIDIPDDVMRCRSLRMMLQPIVENVFKHGFRMTRKGNFMEIGAVKKDNNLFVTIKDNGKGMTQEMLDELRTSWESEDSSSNKIGMANVHLRLKLLYGEEYGLNVKSEYDKYTEVTLKMPINII